MSELELKMLRNELRKALDNAKKQGYGTKEPARTTFVKGEPIYEEEKTVFDLNAPYDELERLKFFVKETDIPENLKGFICEAMETGYSLGKLFYEIKQRLNTHFALERAKARRNNP